MIFFKRELKLLIERLVSYWGIMGCDFGFVIDIAGFSFLVLK